MCVIHVLISLTFQNLDLTRHKMIHDGQLIWRIGKTKSIDLQVLLLEDILVLIQRQDDKYVKIYTICKEFHKDKILLLFFF